MYRRFLTLVPVVAILLMAVPQLFQAADRLDKVSDIGNDTECMLIVIGICIGLCLLSALLAVKLLSVAAAILLRLMPEIARAAQSRSRGSDYLRLLFSPPLSLTSLRI